MNHDHGVLRGLARQWMAWANDPVMDERRWAWTRLADGCAERPMVLFETGTLEDYLDDVALECEDPALRGVERSLRWTLRQVAEIGDDTVIEPVLRLGWNVFASDYGVPIAAHHAVDSSGRQHAYAFDNPIATPSDLSRLRPRTFSVDREATLASAERLQTAFGDEIEVAIYGTEGLHAAFTSDLFRLIGNENLLLWPLDEPDALRWLLAYLRDDRLAWYGFLEREGLLGLNNHFTFVGSGSPGYTTLLPTADYEPPGPVRLKDLWLWMESQETTMVSPDMFVEFFLPPMAEVSALFGRIYYGCCEPVHDRWPAIAQAIPHVGKVSVSPWCDMQRLREVMDRRVVWSRKPKPAPMSGPTPDWTELEADLRTTYQAAYHGDGTFPLEIIFRDVYRICGDRPRLRRWVALARQLGEEYWAGVSGR